MEGSNRFGQEPGFNSGQRSDRPAQQQRFVGDITIGPNGRVFMEGGPKIKRGAPVPGTSNRKQRNSGQRNR